MLILNYKVPISPNQNMSSNDQTFWLYQFTSKRRLKQCQGKFSTVGSTIKNENYPQKNIHRSPYDERTLRLTCPTASCSPHSRKPHSCRVSRSYSLQHGRVDGVRNMSGALAAAVRGGLTQRAREGRNTARRDGADRDDAGCVPGGRERRS